MATTPARLAHHALTAPDPRERLRAITELRAELQALETDAVRSAVGLGASWSEVAKALGVSKQSAHKRFSKAVSERERHNGRRAAEPNHRIVVTIGARHAVRAARAAARALGHPEADTSHLLLGLLADAESPTTRALEAIGARFDNVQGAMMSWHSTNRRRRLGSAPIATEMRGALEQSLREALRLGHTHLGAEHLLLGLVRDRSAAAAAVFERLRVSEADLERCLGKVLLAASFEPR